MKLRNKKTGKIVELDHFSMHYNRQEEWGQQPCSTWDHSLAELNEEWEDYTPKEPLIKDEKVRRAFRAWAETLGNSSADVYKYDAERFSFNSHVADSTIEFAKTAGIDCEDRQLYTLEELCGSEDEDKE